MTDPASQCAQLIQGAQRIVALTGAGISTSAGIPDFRGPKGLYVTRAYDPDIIFDIHYFYKDPKPFFDFARDFITLEKSLKPTSTHSFLAKLEAEGKLEGVVTQNIDALHQQAGSNNVLEMHGSFWESHCLECEKCFSFEQLKTDLFKSDTLRCSCSGVIKPDIVFFGENVKHYYESIELVRTADLFFVIGTSCVVHPAALLPDYAQGQIVVVNGSPVALRNEAGTLHIQSDIDEFFLKVAECL